VNHQQDYADDEENPRDLRGDGRHTRGTKNTGNQPNYQEH